VATGAFPTAVAAVAVPKAFGDPFSDSPARCRAEAEQIAIRPVLGSPLSLTWIWQQFTDCFHLTHPKSGRSGSAEAEQAEVRWSKLVEMIGALLGEKPVVDQRTHQIQLFGRPAHQAALSQGQNVLLQLAVALDAKSATLDNTVVFMDEPENHLHPSAVIDVLERLQAASDRMQFWIATHSVPLLAYLHAQDANCLWYVEDAGVQHAGKLQQRVLESLLGNAARLEQLRTFVALPEQVAIEQFAVECLDPPGVSDKGQGDPLVKQIADVIDTLRASRRGALEVLDFGAGRGRLLAGMFADQPNGFRDRVSYRALDEYPTGKDECVRIIESVYESSEGRYFSDISTFHNDRPVEADLLVLCNVLHEMPPMDWQRRFGTDNNFARMLAADGYLLVVEDQEIRVGEHAHEFGFLLLDTDELKALFAVEQADIDAKRFLVTKDPKRGDRLKAHWIAAKLMKRVSRSTIGDALARLRKRTRLEIEKLRRRTGGDAKHNGQAHARAAMLFANASLALESWGTER
jgi:hypothetical protein